MEQVSKCGADLRRALDPTAEASFADLAFRAGRSSSTYGSAADARQASRINWIGPSADKASSGFEDARRRAQGRQPLGMSDEQASQNY